MKIILYLLRLKLGQMIRTVKGKKTIFRFTEHLKRNKMHKISADQHVVCACKSTGQEGGTSGWEPLVPAKYTRRSEEREQGQRAVIKTLVCELRELTVSW